MAIPKYDEMMLPLLDMMSDGAEYSQRDLAESLANAFQLSPEERAPKHSVSDEKLPH